MDEEANFIAIESGMGPDVWSRKTACCSLSPWSVLVRRGLLSKRSFTQGLVRFGRCIVRTRAYRSDVRLRECPLTRTCCLRMRDGSK